MIYHLGRNGEPARCRATKRDCPLGGPHGTLMELESHIEHLMVGRKLTQSGEPWPTDLLQGELEFWKSLDANLGVIYRNGCFFVMGDPAYSPYYCSTCYTRLPKSDLYTAATWRIDCPGCGESIEDMFVGIALKVEDEPLLEKSEVHNRFWYHYTSRDDWEDQLNDGTSRLIHLGNQTAAIERERELRGQGENQRVFKIRVKPSAPVLTKIYDEDPQEIDEFKKAENVDEPALIRYLNHYEDPGSISLLADAKTLEIVEVRSLDEARAAAF